MSADKSIETIALCLSGGGYRAAVFHLGTIDMLNELGLLDKVKLLSTVSGGTFTGVSYAMWRINQPNLEKFADFYQEFYCFAADNNIIEEAIELLTKEAEKDSDKDLSLIRGAAAIYNKTLPFSSGKYFGDLYDSQGKLKAPFKDLIFNATEFLHGNSFRFRASQSNKIVIGNKFFEIDQESAKHILLADIIAASSCFPGGFEPLIFPDEFVWKKEISYNLTPAYLIELAEFYQELDEYYANLLENPDKPKPVEPLPPANKTTITGREIILVDFIKRLNTYYDNLAEYFQNIADNIPNKFKPLKPLNDFFYENLTPKSDQNGQPITVPLMDGGIYDNQGISSMLLADQTNNNDIDVFMISDTSPRNDEILPPQKKFDLAKMLGWSENSTAAKIAVTPLEKVAGKLWNWVFWISLAVGGVSLIYVFSLLYKIFTFVSNNPISLVNALWMIFFYFLPLTVLIGIIAAVFGVFAVKNKIIKRLGSLREIKIMGAGFKLLEFYEKTTINDIGNQFSTRITSLLAMTSNVFMKAIRAEQYVHINQYDVIDLSRKTPPEKPETSGRIAYNLIYDLNPNNKRTKLWKADKDLIPTAEMTEISLNAENVGTNLWFEKNSDKQKNLVICGQITVCLSVMKFLIENRGTIPNDPNSPYHALYMHVKERWMKLKTNPAAFYRDLNCPKSS